MFTEDQLLVSVFFSHINATISNAKFLKNAEGIEITGTDQHKNWNNSLYDLAIQIFRENYECEKSMS